MDAAPFENVQLCLRGSCDAERTKKQGTTSGSGVPQGNLGLAKPENAGETGGGASWMDASALEQVKSNAISPMRYSEARAIEEAMRCSLEQEFHLDVTLTLNRWQFRKRLSPMFKARAQRWRSDVAANGDEDNQLTLLWPLPAGLFRLGNAPWKGLRTRRSWRHSC